jgi:hypothetical protein
MYGITIPAGNVVSGAAEGTLMGVDGRVEEFDWLVLAPVVFDPGTVMLNVSRK